MKWAEDGSEVTLSLEEYTVMVDKTKANVDEHKSLVEAIKKTRELVQVAITANNEAQQLANDAIKKEDMILRNAQLTEQINLLLSDRKRMISTLEHCMTEGYVILGNESRYVRTNVEKRLIALKPIRPKYNGEINMESKG